LFFNSLFAQYYKQRTDIFPQPQQKKLHTGTICHA